MHPLLDRFSALPLVFYRFLISARGDWRFTYISDEILEIYEVSPEAVLRDHNTLTGRIHPDDRDRHRASVNYCFEHMLPWRNDHRIIVERGATKWVRVQAVPEKLEDGSVQWNGAIVDITDLKELEEASIQKRLANAQLDIAKELHDSLGSELFGISLQLSGLCSRHPELREYLSKSIVELELAVKRTRLIARGLVEPVSEKNSTIQELQKLCEETQIRTGNLCKFDFEGNLSAVRDYKGSQLLKISQEAVTNALRHGHAKVICIKLRSLDKRQVLTIKDDGIGFKKESRKDLFSLGFGVRSMRNRAFDTGGEFEILENADRGITIRVTWPIQ